MESPRFGLECDSNFKWWEGTIPSPRSAKSETDRLESVKQTVISDVDIGHELGWERSQRLQNHKITNNEGLETQLLNYNQLSTHIQTNINHPFVHVHLDKPKDKTIAERIRNGELMYYQDFIDAEFLKDYAKMGTVPLNLKQNIHHEPIISDEKVTNIQKPINISDNNIKSDDDIRVDNLNVNNNPKYVEGIEDVTDPIQKEELLRGELPTFFKPIKVKQVHPRDKIVSYNCLANYARYVDKVTRCPLLQSEMQGIGVNDEDEKVLSESGNNEKKIDVYGVSDSQLDEARSILDERRQVAAEMEMRSKFKISGKLQKYEEPKIIKSRYVI